MKRQVMDAKDTPLLYNRIIGNKSIKYTRVYHSIGDTMQATTIKIQTQTKEQLNTFREYKNESYDEVIQKLVYIATNIDKNPEISKETVHAIEKARERIKNGNFVTEEEAAKRLGL